MKPSQYLKAVLSLFLFTAFNGVAQAADSESTEVCKTKFKVGDEAYFNEPVKEDVIQKGHEKEIPEGCEDIKLGLGTVKNISEDGTVIFERNSEDSHSSNTKLYCTSHSFIKVLGRYEVKCKDLSKLFKRNLACEEKHKNDVVYQKDPNTQVMDKGISGHASKVFGDCDDVKSKKPEGVVMTTMAMGAGGISTMIGDINGFGFETKSNRKAVSDLRSKSSTLPDKAPFAAPAAPAASGGRAN